MPMSTDDRRLTLSREQEIWGMALQVERLHGANGWLHIASEQDRLLELGEFEGVALWREVGLCFERLQAGLSGNEEHGATH
jgi:hypothetical protein